VKISESCVACVSSRRFIADQATLRCRFAFSANNELAPQLVIDLIADYMVLEEDNGDGNDDG